MHIYKSLKLFVLVFFIATVAFFAGCGGGITPPITPDLPDLEEEYNIITEIGGSAAEEYLNFKDTDGEEQALQNTVDYLNQQEGIENVSLDEESGTISFEFENGHLGIIVTYDVTKSQKLEAGKGEPSLPIEGIKHLLKGTPTKKKALLLHPFPTLFVGNSAQYIKGKLEAIGYQCDYYEGEAVTVELMKNMEDYGIIYIDTHGGIANSRYGKEVDFIVGQKGNEQLYEKYASDLYYHYLAHFWIPSFSLSHYFAILPHFIGEYAETSYPNSLIYIDACNSYKNPTMAAAFVEEGAYVYCGYSSFIMAWNYSEQTVFDNMIDEAMTIQEAVNEVGASNLHFRPEEGGNFYLVNDDTYALRDIGPAGGYIFYDKGSYSNGWRYLEAAPVSTEWADIEFSSSLGLIGATGTGIGTGQSNTTKIVTWLNNNGETGKAAQLCNSLVYGGYSDWFLPSIDELHSMYTNLKVYGVGGFKTGTHDYYWSSSEKDADDSWAFRFNDNYQGIGWKYSTNYVRAVQAF